MPKVETVGRRCANPKCRRFFTFTKTGDKTRVKYCSPKCSKEMNKYKPKGTYERLCKTCGTKYQTIYPKQVYCSSDCQRSVGHQKYIESKGVTTKVCKGCRKEFTTTSRTKQYCSRECYKEAKRIRDSEFYAKRKKELKLQEEKDTYKKD